MNGFDADQIDLMWVKANEIGLRRAEMFFPEDADFDEVKERFAKQVALEEFRTMTTPHPPVRIPKRLHGWL